jgi:hypothetical protein
MTGMSIQEISSDIKRLFWSHDLLLFGVIITVACGSFWLGRTSVSDGEGNEPTGDEAAVLSPIIEKGETGVQAEEEILAPRSDNAGVALPTGEKYVGSKNGTKYHLPWCSGALRIKEENKVWFASKSDAEAAGYSPAANCKGI